MSHYFVKNPEFFGIYVWVQKTLTRVPIKKRCWDDVISTDPTTGKVTLDELPGVLPLDFRSRKVRSHLHNVSNLVLEDGFRCGVTS
jgi:hypothetical protein